jgi:hypothetical protein
VGACFYSTHTSYYITNNYSLHTTLNSPVHFYGGRKIGEPRVKPLKKGGEQQQTQLTYDTESGNQTGVTMVRGERPHHYTTHVSYKKMLPIDQVTIKKKFPLVYIACTVPYSIKMYFY